MVLPSLVGHGPQDHVLAKFMKAAAMLVVAKAEKNALSILGSLPLLVRPPRVGWGAADTEEAGLGLPRRTKTARTQGGRTQKAENFTNFLMLTPGDSRLVDVVWEDSRPRRPLARDDVRPDHRGDHDRGATMSKRARKRRSRKGNAANHGRKPNA